MIKIKRVYEAPATDDGFRVLVDRIWPRGLAKEKAAIDWWLKDIAPTTALRKWFGHEEKKWKSFQEKYTRELKQNEEAVQNLRKVIQKESVVTLLYAASETRHNQAVVLKEYISKA